VVKLCGKLGGLAGALLIATLGPTFAQTVHVGGRGIEACEYFLASRDEADEQWILGFLSGYAVASGSDILNTTSHEKIFKEIARRCTLKLKARLFDITREVAREWRD
jgi:hypothetical protein